MKPALFLILVAATLSFLSCGQDNKDPTGPNDITEGQWVSYWSGSQPSRFDLSVKYYCVRFTKPTDWEVISIDSLKIVATTAGEIQPCFWGDHSLSDNQYWPVNPPSNGQTESVMYGGNLWSVVQNNWTTAQAEFFVGIEQTGSNITLCGDGQNIPENRSYRQYAGSDWTQEWGMLANYCIEVYISNKSP